VTTILELPKVCVGDSLLTARTIGPAQVTAGIAFTYSLQVGATHFLCVCGRWGDGGWQTDGEIAQHKLQHNRIHVLVAGGQAEGT
jgi:hypothetical protein